MFDEAAAAGVVIVACGGGAAEALAQFGQEHRAKGEQAGIGDARDGGLDVFIIARLFLAKRARAGQERLDFIGVEGAAGPGFGVEAVGGAGLELAGDLEEGALGEFGALLEIGRVIPGAEDKTGLGVGEDQLPEGLALLGFFLKEGVNLTVNPRGGPARLGCGTQFGDRKQVNHGAGYPSGGGLEIAIF